MHETQPQSDHDRLFDDFGRCFPSHVLSAAHRESRRYFTLQQPTIDYAQIYRRIRTHLNANISLSESDFSIRAERILTDLRSDPRTQDIAQGVHVPFLLPKAKTEDIGLSMETQYLPAVQASFQEHFPNYSFTNHHAGGLLNKLSPAPQSRHEQLITALDNGDVVGYYFPCFLEFSIPAAIEQLRALPEKFLLAGGFDTSAAFVGTPDLLLRTDGYPPMLWFAGLSGEKPGIGYHFEAYGYNLTFNRRPHLNKAAEYWACGLVVLGK